ncbi:MAG: metal-dependent hydrolase [Pyrinomonadaceae bacterium]
MFIGHFAVGFALKRATPRTNLGWLMAAPILLDMLWPIFVLAGIERVEIEPGNTAFTPLNFVSYPYSHSLAGAAVWSMLFAVIYYLFSGSRSRRGVIAVMIGVISHWVLDVVTHRADMPIYPGGTQLVGLGLWNSVAATVLIESIMFAGGVWIYARMTRAKDKIGSVAFWAFVVFLVVAYLVSSFGPPPPSVTAVAVTALLVWVLPFWAKWFDRHRIVDEPRVLG